MAGALALAGIGLDALFQRHVERRAIAELQVYQRVLAAGLQFDKDGKIGAARQPSDPNFSAPYGGLYWQVSSSGKTLLRSRSLWDFELPLPEDSLPRDGAHVHDLNGPEGTRLIAVERALILSRNGQPVTFRLTVAADRAPLRAASRAFTRELLIALLLLGAFLAIASYIQVTVGLRPLFRLRENLAAVRRADCERLDENVPAEVMPLASEINGLLAEQEKSVTRARFRAADLAHGLKTPLAVLESDIRHLKSQGEVEAAARIKTVSSVMRRHIDAELSRARIAGRRARGRRKPMPVRPALESIVAVIARTPEAAGLEFDLDLDPGIELAIDTADFSELAGNLTENAVRFARKRIRISCTHAAGARTFAVSDDGPGIEPEQMGRIVQRGESMDRRGGAGLGLSIVDEIVEAYGGTLALSRACEGGLQVTLTIPDPDVQASSAIGAGK